MATESDRSFLSCCLRRNAKMNTYACRAAIPFGSDSEQANKQLANDRNQAKETKKIQFFIINRKACRFIAPFSDFLSRCSTLIFLLFHLSLSLSPTICDTLCFVCSVVAIEQQRHSFQRLSFYVRG